jgi:ubiquinone/menaquinone biosynthesis C-methylase UbiE
MRRASARLGVVGFTTFVLSHLPPPPRRVLEVGCGQGELALALAAVGYDVVAVDPEAPAGAIFRRTTIEELDEPGPFDAVTAAFSLHHVEDLDAVLDKLRDLLDGVLIVDEFGWDLLDEATARQYELDMDDWRLEHADLHGFGKLRRALGQRFAERHFDWEPYFSKHLGADEDEERRLIEAGKIRPLGFRFVGS